MSFVVVDIVRSKMKEIVKLALNTAFSITVISALLASIFHPIILKENINLASLSVFSAISFIVSFISTFLLLKISDDAIKRAKNG